MKKIGFVAVCGAYALAAVGCGDDGGRRTDAGGIVLDDAGTDSGMTGTDSGPRPDSGSPPTGCDRVGIACSPDRGCLTGECESRLGEYPIGGPSDPIQGHPDGDETVVNAAYFPNGYCTPNPLNYVNSGGCDPNDETSCGDCAACLNLGPDSTGQTLSMCFKTCEPSLTENTCPQDDQDCSLGSGVCIWGCGSDDECAVYRGDTNGDGEIDPYDATENPGGDHLVYDDAGWTCNTTTNRCEHPTPDGAEAGIPCELDSQCENYGRCIDEINYEWPGGYCLKFGCDVPGNECEGDGVCDTRLFGDPVCLSPCEVGATATADDDYSHARDCREGYSCSWDGASGAGADNGLCIPGNYNDVRAANTGATCNTSGDGEECHSPFGMGQCRDWDGAEGPGGGYCTIFDCGAPGLDSDTICGDGAICAGVSMSVTTLCMQTCDTAADCTDGYGCWDTTPAGITTGGETICFAGCLEDSHCRSGETCVGGSSTTLGQCE